jgi:UDP-glucose 4-epimerase
MHIIITGGVGAIGSHLINNLPTEWKITVVDNLLTQRYCSLFNLDRPIIFREKSFLDITEKELHQVNCVIHLAAITNAVGANPKDIEKTNVVDTKQFINKCFNNVPLFINMSSTSVYGVSTDIVHEDDDNVIKPQSTYAESKWEIEQYIREKSSLTKYVTLRCGTIFGISPGMRFHTAINRFCYDAVVNKKLTIWKENYEQVRPYLGIDDYFFCITHLLNNLDIWNQTYNIVSENCRLDKTVQYIQKYSKEKIELDFINTPLLNQFSYNVNTDKIQKTGFSFISSIEQGIRNTLNLLKNIN